MDMVAYIVLLAVLFALFVWLAGGGVRGPRVPVAPARRGRAPGLRSGGVSRGVRPGRRVPAQCRGAGQPRCKVAVGIAAVLPLALPG